MDRRRSSSARYRDHRWVRARVGRAEADDGHGKRELHLEWQPALDTDRGISCEEFD